MKKGEAFYKAAGRDGKSRHEPWQEHRTLVGRKLGKQRQLRKKGICIPSISKRWKDLRVSEVEIVSMHTSEACICGFITGEAYNVRVHISAVHVKGGKPHYTSY